MLGSRLYAAIVRGTRVQTHALQHSNLLTTTRLQPLAWQATLARRAFAIPAKPKKGSSAESSPKRPRASKATTTASTATKKTKAQKRATPEQAAAKKLAQREKRDKQKARDQAKKLKLKLKAKQKKVLTPEQEARKKLRDEKADTKLLKAAALSPPSKGTTTAWVVFNSEFVKSQVSGSSSSGTRDVQEVRSKLASAARESARAYKNLSPAERESYNRRANEQTADRQREYKEWLASHTPRQILRANIARRRLRSKETIGKNVPSRWQAIEDDRLPKSPPTPFLQFYQERIGSGDFLNIATSESTKLIAQEWKELSDASRQGYLDTYREQREDYAKAYTNAIGQAPGTRLTATTLAA